MNAFRSLVTIAILGIAHTASATSITFLNSSGITIPSGGAATPDPSLLSTPAGTWKLFIYDDNFGDLGSVGSWGVQLEVVGGFVTDVNVLLNSFSHTFLGDVDMYLVGPNNVALELTTDNGSSGDASGNYVFDDQASLWMIVGVAPDATGKIAPGSYRPEGASAASSTPALIQVGPGTFYTASGVARDLAGFNGLAYDDGTGAAAVPEPGTVLLVGGGLTALVRRRYRRLRP